MGLDFNSAKKNFKRILILYESVLQDLNVNRGNILHCTYREVDNIYQPMKQFALAHFSSSPNCYANSNIDSVYFDKFFMSKVLGMKS